MFLAQYLLPYTQNEKKKKKLDELKIMSKLVSVQLGHGLRTEFKFRIFFEVCYIIGDIQR